MNVSGIWVCFNCRTRGNPEYDTVDGKQVRTKPGVTMRHLEVRRPGKYGGKGKVVAEATVCQHCYDLGFNKVPVGGFNGYVPKSKELPPEIREFLKKKQAEAEAQVAKPLYPLSSKPPSSTEHETKHKPQETQEKLSPQ